jgi:hypothetical protein
MLYFAGDCTAGYFCMNGSASATPTDGVTGQKCPEGHYCLLGTTDPTPCGLGTWSNSTGLSVLAECQDCLGGYYCNVLGITAPSGPCDAG